jgi:hypothetical protein
MFLKTPEDSSVLISADRDPIRVVSDHCHVLSKRALGCAYISEVKEMVPNRHIDYYMEEGPEQHGTSGIKAYAEAIGSTISVTKIPRRDSSDKWIMMGNAIKRMRVNNLRSVAASEPTPHGDIFFARRLGSNNMIQTHKGPLYVSDVYTEVKVPLMAEKILGVWYHIRRFALKLVRIIKSLLMGLFGKHVKDQERQT